MDIPRNGLISQKGKTRILRTRRQGTTRTKGNIRLNLVDLPMDIIFEIFGYLEPLDLLRLLETSKAARALLVSPHSRGIWRRARDNIFALPDCPDDLTEIEYAGLVFESHCEGCNQGRSYDASTVRVWSARVRYCPDCLDQEFVPKQTSRKSKESYPNEVKALLPSVTGWHGHGTISALHDKLWEKEYKRQKTVADKRRWTEAKVAERRKINKHADECAAWFANYGEKAQKDRRNKVFETHREKILDRLRQSGWEEELRINEFCDDLLDNRRVRRICERELTEEVLKDLVNYLTDDLKFAKQKRLAEER